MDSHPLSPALDTAAMTSTTTSPIAPVLHSVTCTQAGDKPAFALTWTSESTSLSVVINVTDAQGKAVAGTSQIGKNGGSWQASAILSGDQPYYVQLSLDRAVGIVSAKALLLFVPVSGITTAYDGQRLTLSWKPLSVVPQGFAVLLQTAAGNQTALATVGNGIEFEVAAGIRDVAGPWSVLVTPHAPLSSGPQSAAATVYTARPLIRQARVIGSTGPAAALTQLRLELELGATTPQSANVVAAVRQGGEVVALSAPVQVIWSDKLGTTTASVTGYFNLGLVFEVTAALSAATAGQALGPESSGVPLLLAPPSGLQASVRVDGSQVLVTTTIEPAPGVAQPTGSVIALNGPGLPATTGTLGNGYSQTTTIANATIGGSYVAYAASAQGMSLSQWAGGIGNDPGSAAPSGTAYPIITTTPQLKWVKVVDGLARISWAAVPDNGVIGYLVTAMVEGAVVAQELFSGTLAVLAITDNGASFSVAAVGANCTGPESAAVTALTGVASGLQASYPAAGGNCTLSWTPYEGRGAKASGYNLEIWSGEALLHSATTPDPSYLVPAGILTDAGGFSFRVSANAADGAVGLRGPWTEQVPLLAAAPATLSVAYDGATLSAHWAAVVGATGYRLVLLEAGHESSTPWLVAAPASSVALPFAANKSYSLSVQAVGPGVTGPAAIAEVFQAGLYPQAAGQNVLTLIPATQPNMAAHELVIGLPQIFLTPPATLPAVAPFSLAAASAPYSWQLTIAGQADALPWSFSDTALRTDLLTAYNDFLSALEKATATPEGIRTVQAAIARAMPQTFAETLFYSYRFDPASGYVDLLPGMALRVEYEGYVSLPAGTADQLYLNGYVTSAVSRYPIGRGASGGASFPTLDAFVGLLTGQGGTTVPQPLVSGRKQGGAGGLIDSSTSTMSRPYLRLIYPQTFPAANQPGSPIPELTAILIAADKLSALEAATNAARAGQDASQYAGVIYFRGRATAVAEISVALDGTQQWVALGTTLGQLLATQAQEPAATALPISGLQLRRGIGPAPAGRPALYNASATTPLRVDWAPAANSGLTTLPLLGGDRITLGSGT